MQVSKFITAVLIISCFVFTVLPTKAEQVKQQNSTDVSNITEHPISSQLQQESSAILPQGVRRSRGYCQLLPPNTLDKTDVFLCREAWGVTFHGYLIRISNICLDVLSASNLMESFDFCERGLEAGECKIYPPGVRTKNDRYCANASWLVTFQGYPVDDSCNSIDEAFSKMDRVCSP